MMPAKAQASKRAEGAPNRTPDTKAKSAAAAPPPPPPTLPTLSRKEKRNTLHRNSTLQLFFPKDYIALLVGLLVAVALFSNGFSPELIFDDHLAIENNRDAATDRGVSLKEIFFHDFWGHQLESRSSNGSYRPLVILTFRIQYVLAGLKHNGYHLHAFNFAVAYVNACLVYFLARLYHQMLQRRHTKEKIEAGSPTKEADGPSRWLTDEPYALPTMTMLIFLVHPVHVDSVTSIVGRCELLYCLFGLLAFFALHSYATCGLGEHAQTTVQAQVGYGKRMGQQSAPSRRKSGLRRQGFLLATVAFMVCCLLCKDSGVTFTALFLLHSGLLYAWGLTNRRRALVSVAVSLAIMLSYFSFRRNFIGLVDLSKSPLIRRTENPQYFIPDGIWHWLSMRWTIQVKNFELLFYPTTLCAEYNYNCIPHMESLHDSRLPYYVTVSLSILVFILTLVYRSAVLQSRLAVVLLMFLMWIAVPYAPVSHIFVKVGTFIAERCLYVPSIGVALIYAFLLQPAFTFSRSSGHLLVGGAANGARLLVLLTLIGVWFVMSHERNVAWHTNENLFREAIRVCPSSGKSHAQLGIAVSRRKGRLDEESLSLFQRALELDDEEKGPLYYLAVNEWENKRNPGGGYAFARECVSDPFSVSQCYPLYAEMRAILFPNMTDVEKLLDEALIAPLPSQRAVRYRTAGLMQRALSPSDPCAGLSAFRSALHRWNESQIFWANDEARPEYGDETLCNTAYWYAEVFDKCYLQPEVPDAEKTITRLDDEGEAVPVVKPKKLQRAMRDFRLAAKSCTTNWAAPGVVRGAAPALLKTYGNRLNGHVALSQGLMRTVADMRPFLLTEELLREARLTALMVSMGQYCNFATLLDHADVKEALRADYGDVIREMERLVSAQRGQWRLDIMSRWKQVEHAEGSSEEEQHLLDDWRNEIRQLATCSETLSSVIH